IPNPEAKPLSADGTATARSWESRTPPDHTYQSSHPHTRGWLDCLNTPHHPGRPTTPPPARAGDRCERCGLPIRDAELTLTSSVSVGLLTDPPTGAHIAERRCGIAKERRHDPAHNPESTDGHRSG